MTFRSKEVLNRIDGLINDLRRLKALLRKSILPCVTRETSSRSSIKPRELLDVSVDGIPAPFQIFGIRRAGSDRGGAAHGRQRVAQLVGQHGEERVLVLRGLTKRLRLPPPLVLQMLPGCDVT